MPILEEQEQLDRLGNLGFFVTFDKLSGFDFLRTHKESQQYFILVT